MANYKEIFSAIENTTDESGFDKDIFNNEANTYDDGRLIFDEFYNNPYPGGEF